MPTWIHINSGLDIRLRGDQPEFSSSEGAGLLQVIEIVTFWLRTHDNDEVEAWLECATDRADLERRASGWLILLQLGRRDATIEDAMEVARRSQAFDKGVHAFNSRAFDLSIELLKPLAEFGLPGAQLYMGMICALGDGDLRNDVQAYVWFDRAAKHRSGYPADECRARIVERLSPEDLAIARRIASQGGGHYSRLKNRDEDQRPVNRL